MGSSLSLVSITADFTTLHSLLMTHCGTTNLPAYKNPSPVLRKELGLCMIFQLQRVPKNISVKLIMNEKEHERELTTETSTEFHVCYVHAVSKDS